MFGLLVYAWFIGMLGWRNKKRSVILSPKFQLLLVKEYQRLKEQEQAQLGWSA
jgi:hypothetical protein